MSIIKEFRDFAMRGNVVDMAIGIIIGGAFGKIVSSFVNDILMPPLGMLIGGLDFTDFKVILKDSVLNQAGEVVANEVAITYGDFIQTTVDFVIIAFAIFMMIRGINTMKKKQEAAPEPPPAPTPEQELLTEIRDLLKK